MLISLWSQFLASESSDKDGGQFIYSLLKQLEPKELTQEKIVLACDNQGFKFFLQKKVPEIEDRLSKFLNRRVVVDIVVVPKKRASEAPLLQFQPSIDDIFKKSGLSGRFSLENFAVSSTNQVAYAASQAVVDRLGHSYNPLFLYGDVGVGKTHLAQAVGRVILEKSPSKKVYFCPGDQFTNELIEAIRERSTAKFRRKYRHLDLLVVDDIQFIAGKNAVQEEFFHTFNAIVSAGGQIILTSDRPPAAIKKLEDRLRSRFSGGLIVDIQEPDYELRAAILLIKAREKNIEIDLEAAKVIAEQTKDTRALEGTLLSLYASILGKKERIDLESVDVFFQRATAQPRAQTITPKDIVATVSSYYDIKPSYIKSERRTDSIALPRQIIMFLLRRQLKMKFEEIAHLLKRKDHTTILHGVEKINRLIAKDVVFKGEIDRIINSLSLSTSYSP